MPIRPENRDRYPKDWLQIRELILLRARNRCECAGECGYGDHHIWPPGLYGEPIENRCGAVNGQPHPETGSTVVLTIAHLDHVPENCDEDNLRAMCQRCHLAYDQEHHMQQREMNRRIELEAAGQERLFE